MKRLYESIYNFSSEFQKIVLIQRLKILGAGFLKHVRRSYAVIILLKWSQPFLLSKKSRQITQETLWPHRFNEKNVHQNFLVKSAEERNYKCEKQRKSTKNRQKNHTLSWQRIISSIHTSFNKKFSSLTSIVLTRKLSVRNIFVFIKSAEESNW